MNKISEEVSCNSFLKNSEAVTIIVKYLNETNHGFLDKKAGEAIVVLANHFIIQDCSCWMLQETPGAFLNKEGEEISEYRLVKNPNPLIKSTAITQ